MKYAMVTGGSRGIGKAISIQLAKDGFDVFINYQKNQKAADEVIADIKKEGRQGYAFIGDVSSESDMKKVFVEVSKTSNKLDILVNNAGTDLGKMIEDFTIEEMKMIVDINLIGVFICTKIFLPLLKKSSSAQIINISSRMGKEKIIETIGAYGPAKAGVIKFTQCCALEFMKYKIRANAVLPGLTDTDLNRSLYPENDFWEAMAKKNPSGRVGQPQDVANVVSFLASENGSYINGETIGVNGGSNLV
jgi:NAD(P)-dependent dehydrogenase (short-subunit alcohol dehydrogenase family)